MRRLKPLMRKDRQSTTTLRVSISLHRLYRLCANSTSTTRFTARQAVTVVVVVAGVRLAASHPHQNRRVYRRSILMTVAVEVRWVGVGVMVRECDKGICHNTLTHTNYTSTTQ